MLSACRYQTGAVAGIWPDRGQYDASFLGQCVNRGVVVAVGLHHRYVSVTQHLLDLRNIATCDGPLEIAGSRLRGHIVHNQPASKTAGPPNNNVVLALHHHLLNVLPDNDAIPVVGIR